MPCSWTRSRLLPCTVPPPPGHTAGKGLAETLQLQVAVYRGAPSSARRDSQLDRPSSFTDSGISETITAEGERTKTVKEIISEWA